MALGNPELLLLIGLALLLFGPNKIPEFARAIGKATNEYKKGIAEAKKTFSGETDSQFSTEELEIIQAAKDAGIPTENRSIEEIASDLVE
ncbi:MAG: twin-arginine translocase TatA/TatE family subunit [Candidatus Heimdallarchaeota archaeon]|nr:twin-arginine translocase TatA/TatE family subunit [Candidatus Heimdallarchaeota archaeon]